MLFMKDVGRKERLRKNTNITSGNDNKGVVGVFIFYLKNLIRLIRKKSQQDDKRDFLILIFNAITSFVIVISVFRFVFFD